MEDYESVLVFFVNGKKIEEKCPNPEWSLLYYLRNKLRLCGTKGSCGEGGCGACTVMISRINPKTLEISNCAVNACLLPVCSLHGVAVVTVEGIGSIRSGLHPIQERIALSHGSQCGYCSPGFVISTYALLRNNPTPSEKELEDSLRGNLCRCTGYRPILEGLKTFCGAQNCCRNRDGETRDEDSGNKQKIELIFDPSELKPYDPSQDLIFPPELKVNYDDYTTGLKFQHDDLTWFRPKDLKNLLELKTRYPEAALVGGHTNISYHKRETGKIYPVYIQITQSIPELEGLELDLKTGHFTIGAAVTFGQLRSFCLQILEQEEVSNPHKRLFSSLNELLERFGDLQTRNVATIGGSIAAGSSTSDSNPFFIAAESVLTVHSQERGVRDVKLEEILSQDGNLQPDEIITNLKIPLLSQNEFIWRAKQSRRRDVDAAIVNLAIKIKFQEETTDNIVEDIRILFSGVSLGGINTAVNTQNLIRGRSWKNIKEENILQNCYSQDLSDIPLNNRDRNISEEYCKCLVGSMLFKFNSTVFQWLQSQSNDSERSQSEFREVSFPSKKSSQLFQVVPPEQSVDDLVGRPLVHLSAKKQTCGEAVYLEDLPPLDNELHGVFILSEKAHAKILKMNYEKALAVPGVVKIYDSSSLPKERNVYGLMGVKDDVIFAQDVVHCWGQPIAFLVAESREIAMRASKLVSVEYEDLSPVILTLEDAIAEKSFMEEVPLARGDVEDAFGKSVNIIEGEFRIGSQKHYYMENCGCIAEPKEDDEIHVTSTTQSQTTGQGLISQCLGLKFHKIIIKTKRIGGGFGGKETRIHVITVATSLAAHDLKRPVRCVLPRNHDMQIIGGRNRMLFRYKAGFDDDGRINGIKANIYSDGGISMDYSKYIMLFCVRAASTAYKIEHWDLKGHICRTNNQSTTAFRGFGAPQGHLFIEHIMDTITTKLNMSPVELRAMHFHQDGDTTPAGYLMERCNIQKCWEECMENSDYHGRLEKTREFNKESRWIKRGISLIPISFLIGFPMPVGNQGGALVMIYMDGSVGLNHGGIEMGQGLHTKMIQVASRALGIPAEKIHILETSTDKVPNAITSSASMTTDLQGPAIVNACEILLQRLEPFKQSNPTGSWEEWVGAAFFDRTNLSVTGFNKLLFDGPCNYLSFGAACTEIELDVLSGEFQILRTDIVMDCGESLNPAIDIGQIEGAYVMGTGLFTQEEVLYAPDGQLLSKSPSVYKIPTVSNIPLEFNVSLLRGAPNPRAVYSSKAIGEPPLLLSSSVFFAIKDAIRSTRTENGQSSNFDVYAPATVENIRLTIGDLPLV